jgi:hypothetical protein
VGYGWPLAPLKFLFLIYPIVADLLSVTNKHMMAVEKSHVCHNTLAALLGSFFGVPEHKLKFTVECVNALPFALHLQVESAVCSERFFHCHPSKMKAGTQLAYVPCSPRWGLAGGGYLREREQPPDPLRRLTLGAFISQAMERCL